MPAVLNDCFRHTERLLLHNEAIALLRERLAPIAAVQQIALSSALGRTLGEPVIADRAVPAHTNAAVDGYAFASGEYDPLAGSVFPLVGRAAAGHPTDVALREPHAVRTFTGAAMPAGLDTVAMQEDCEVLGASAEEPRRVRIPPGLRPGANVRRAGEDVGAGEPLFAPGHILRPQDLAALASIGRSQVHCFERVHVGIASSGDELIRPGMAAVSPRQVYDANAPMLSALTRLAGCDAVDLGIWPDRREEVRDRLATASRRFPVMLTSGGASRGEEDHMAGALAALGSRHLWQIAIKPGRPIMFGQIGQTVVVGLPGNPVAVFVCFLLYVWPMLRRLGGTPWPEPRRLRLPAAFSVPKRKTGRREFWRGTLVDSGGGLAVDKFPRDGSGLISGLRAADVLIEVPEDTPGIARGDLVAVIPFTQFGFGAG
jgi:molybdopterin molybdotransferase